MGELDPVDPLPTVGTWYESDEGDCFVVVAVHPEQGMIEIGTLNGALEEMDLEAWSGMALQEIETPEEWHGSMDDFLSAGREESE
jgi:hypothetical protein